MPSTDECIRNMWHIYTRNELLTHLQQEIKLQNIMLRKEATHERLHAVCFHVYEMSGIGKFIESRLATA